MRAGRRRRVGRAFNGLWRGLLWGGVVCLVLGGLYRVYPFPEAFLYAAAAAPLLGMLIGGIVGGWNAGTLQENAQWVDRREKLKERLSTALEVAKDPQAGKWRELILADAAEHARNVDARQMVQFSLNRTARWALPILALCVGLGFVPEYRSKDHLRDQSDKENIKHVGRQLADLTRRSLDKRVPSLEPTQKALEAVEATGQKLAGAGLNRAEALQELASVTDKLKMELNNLGKDPALKRLERSARGSSTISPANAAAIQQQMEALQKQIGTPTGNPESMSKIKQALEELRKQAAAQAQSAGGPSEDQKQQMSSALSALSRQMQDIGLDAPMIDAAMEALAANNTEMFLKNMDAAITDLEKTREMVKAMQQLQQQMDKLGKDLGEQLKFGQPEAAQMTLQKMAEQLRSAGLSAEQMKKLMSEVGKAVDPAGNYGDLAKHLENANRQMGSGNQQAAAESLAKAAKELESLMQQLNDAEALAAELDTLGEATMAIANGQCFGMGAGNRPGTGRRNGQTGSGVGTWAENDGADPFTGEISERWDNSGIDREDMDARGLTDRGPGGLSEALLPTKVRGQFSQGANMPSVTLKGVSIRGQSTVEYQEASAAAQSEAQSALSQEKVPRAYQSAVKDYFDDLKK